MWVNPSFDDPPPGQICDIIKENINNIYVPDLLSNPNPVYARGDSHFNVSSPIPYPSDILDALNNGSCGWLPDIEKFWASHEQCLYLFSSDLSYQASAPVSDLVITVGYLSPAIIVSHKNSIALFTYPDLTPVKNTYTLPTGITITTINGDIAGCSDGSLRFLHLRTSISPTISLSSSLFGVDTTHDQCITKIVRATESTNYLTCSSKYFIVLTLTGDVSVHQIKNLRCVSSPLRQIHNAVSIIDATLPDSNSVSFLIVTSQSEVFLYKDSIKDFKSPQLVKLGCILPRRQTSQMIWGHGIFTAVDSACPSMDHITIGRLSPSASSITIKQIGIAYAIGLSLHPFYETHLLTSLGIINISERFEENAEGEIWRFSSIISPIFHSKIDRLLQKDPYDIVVNNCLSELQELYDKERQYPTAAALTKYLFIIQEDLASIRNFFSTFKQLSKESTIADFFSAKAQKDFPTLRKVSFEINNKNPNISKTDFLPKISALIDILKDPELYDSFRYDESFKAQLEQTTQRIVYNQTAPISFAIMLDFLLLNEKYEELIDCVIRWSDSIMKENVALAFINANCPTFSSEEVSSYYLRQTVYEALKPFLRKAADDVQNHPSSHAIKALKDALTKNGPYFSRFCMSFFESENYPSEIVLHFTYPDILDTLRLIHSKHLAPALFNCGRLAESFHERLETVRSYSLSNQNDHNSNSEQILNEIIDELMPATDEVMKTEVSHADFEKADKMLQTAKILKENHLFDSYKLVGQNSYDIIESLMSMSEYGAALEIADVFKDKRMDLLTEFVKAVDNDQLVIERHRISQGYSIFTMDDLANAIFTAAPDDRSAILRCKKCSIDYIAAFKYLLASKNTSEKQLVNQPTKGELVAELLEDWKEEDVDDSLDSLKIKEEVADIVCDQILIELEKGAEDRANELRCALPKCFLNQNFFDEWDDF